LANRWTTVTGGFNGLTGVPRLHLGPAALTPDGQRVVTALLAVLLICALSALSARPLGAVLMALRDDERRIASLGYNTLALKTGVFAFTGAVAGLLGAIFALQVGFVAPGLIGVAMVTNFVVWTLLGSKATIVGPAVVTVLYNFGASESADKAANYWVLLTGVAFAGVANRLAP
jgi:branched-chain amino acid transport system permease protein